MVKGYADGSTDVDTWLEKLGADIEELPVLVRARLAERPAANKWSAKEITGHLIDSALNNLRRFTEAQFGQEPYVIISYDQNELVKVNRYSELPLEELTGLWQALNRQIYFVIKHTPQQNLQRRIITASSQEVTLAWLFCDYVGHMEHHFRQIRALS